MEEKQEKRWYVIHTYSGYENKVSANLERKVHSLGMENEIFRIVIPMENEVEIKDGKKRSVQRKVFPGYVLVEMIVNDRSWYAVRNTPGVTGFVGSGSKPIPLTEDEVRQIMRSMGVEESRPKIDFQLHQLVRLKTGPFADCLGKVSEINEERGKLKVLVDMFGRETPVEIDFTQVEEAE
ncbi:MAG: transcription termination/antitermination protein NusG [Phascolarctobacterium sp.]|nr:transcription termination/antitermination protein NusG [Phascolarctobacterium sp.]MBQ7882904.1 transcription termination/antitermination protein NusG [Phascolarctobacterium sp.]